MRLKTRTTFRRRIQAWNGFNWNEKILRVENKEQHAATNAASSSLPVVFIFEILKAYTHTNTRVVTCFDSRKLQSYKKYARTHNAVGNNVQEPMGLLGF